MEYPPEPPEEIAEFIKRTNERDRSTNIFLMTQAIVDEGYFLIGTASPEPQAIYAPKERQVFRDTIWKRDVLVDRDKPTLQATWSGKLAIQCALLGDINTPGQRAALNPDIFPERYSYGWSSSPPENSADTLQYNEDLISPHADRRLLPILKRHRTLSGRIDIIKFVPDSFLSTVIVTDEDDVEIRQGMLKTYDSHAVVGSLIAVASDLQYLDMEWRDPERYAR